MSRDQTFRIPNQNHDPEYERELAGRRFGAYLFWRGGFFLISLACLVLAGFMREHSQIYALLAASGVSLVVSLLLWVVLVFMNLKWGNLR